MTNSTADKSQSEEGLVNTSSELQSNTPDVNKYEKKKQLAIEAAARIFGEKGFHGATTQDIADDLGIKQGSLYYYFKSKEQALQQVCEFGLQNYLAEMRAISDQHKQAGAAITEVITAHLSHYRKPHSAMKVHNDQRLYLPKSRRSEIKKLGSEYRQLLEEMIAQGIDQGAFRSNLDPHFATYSIIGLCNAWGANLMRDSSINLVVTTKKCVELILNGVLLTAINR